MEIEGVVKAIATENNNGHDKRVLTLALDNNDVLFVEFQGRHRDMVRDLSANDRIRLRFRFNGKTSNIGRKYNNIIGKSIKKVNK